MFAFGAFNGHNPQLNNGLWHLAERTLRMRVSAILAIYGFFVVCGSAVGFGQVVQLPTFQNTGVSTVVDVPTGGSTYLGGIGRAGATTAARRSFLFGQRSGGIYASGSGNAAIATLIDLKALDEAILKQKLEPGVAVRAGRSPLHLAGKNHPATNYRKISSLPGAYMQALGGDAALSASSGLNTETATEIRELLEHAQAARLGGRMAAAEVYYRMIIERLPADTVAKLEAELKQQQKESATAAAVPKKSSVMTSK